MLDKTLHLIKKLQRKQLAGKAQSNLACIQNQSCNVKQNFKSVWESCCEDNLNLRAWPLALMLLYQGDKVTAGRHRPFSNQNQNNQYVQSFPVIVLWFLFKFCTRKCSCKNKFYSWSKTQKMNITGSGEPLLASGWILWGVWESER